MKFGVTNDGFTVFKMLCHTELQNLPSNTRSHCIERVREIKRLFLKRCCFL